MLLLTGFSIFGLSDVNAEPPKAIRNDGLPQKDTYTAWEAYQASDDKIVLFYGEGFMDAALMAEILVEGGYPAIALPGGKPGTLTLIVDRSGPINYTQRQLNDGTVGDDAKGIYNDRVTSKKIPTTESK